MPVMRNDNDLHGNRVVHSDSQGQAGTEQPQSKKEYEKKSAQEGVQKAGKTAGAAVGAYFGGSTGAKVGAKVGDAIGKSKVGQQLGKNLAKNPLTRKKLSKLNDSGAIDAANKVTDIATADPKGGMGGSDFAGKAADTASSSGKVPDSAGSSYSGGSVFDRNPSRPNFLDNDSDNSNQSGKGSFTGVLTGNLAVKMTIGGIFVLGFLIFVFLIGIGQNAGIISSFDDAFGVSSTSGGETGGIDYSTSDPKAQGFFDRVSEVKNTFQMQGKSFNPVYISAVYVILNQNNAKLSYDDMTIDVISDIANSMFSGNSFSKDIFKQNLISTILPKYLPGKSTDKYEVMADEIFQYYEDYYSLIGSTASNCASLGSCLYEIKGFYIEGKGNISKSLSISDLQVRLMQSGVGNGHDYGGTWGQPMEGEELVPFEKYILGVAYQEIGPTAPDEAIKAQMVAARSYILARPFDMGGWRKIEQESNGKWVIQVAGSTQDQVYCDPDQGCSTDGDGQWSQVFSGLDHPKVVKNPLPVDHRMRTLANETMGEVLVNDQGNIVYSGYVDTEQKIFENLANQGLDYKQILLQVYNQSPRNYGATGIHKMSCNTGSGGACAGEGTVGSSGPYSGWKQADPAWGNITIGNTSKTIAGVGCLATSVSMLIAKSGVPTTVEGSFNPGSFVKKLSATGGFSGANLVWASVSNAAPTFVFQNKIYVLGQSTTQKLETIKNLLSQGYYVVAEVKGNTGQHWVAIDGVDNNNVIMMDPASQSTNMWQQYNSANTSQLAYFKVMS